MKNAKSEVKVFRSSEKRTKSQIAKEIIENAEYNDFEKHPSKNEVIDKLTDKICKKFMDEVVHHASYIHNGGSETIYELIEETPSLSELFN